MYEGFGPMSCPGSPSVDVVVRDGAEGDGKAFFSWSALSVVMDFTDVGVEVAVDVTSYGVEVPCKALPDVVVLVSIAVAEFAAGEGVAIILAELLPIHAFSYEMRCHVADSRFEHFTMWKILEA